MEESKNDVLFGTVMFGGFNRKNVMDYIDKLQKKQLECGTLQDTRQANRLKQAELELEDARAQIRSLTEQLERTSAEKAELSEQLEAVRAQSVPQDEVTQLKAQLRVEQAENELLREKSLRQSACDISAESVEEPNGEPKSSPASLDDVDRMVQKNFS